MQRLSRTPTISERLHRDSKARAEKLEAQRKEFLRVEEEKIKIGRINGLKATAEINRNISRNFQVLYSDSFKRREKREAEKNKALAAEDENLRREIVQVFPTRAVSQNVSRASFKENSMCQESSVVSRLLAAKETREKKVEKMRNQLEQEEAAKIEASKVARLPRPREDKQKAEMFAQVLTHRRSKSCGPTNLRLN